jgi:hypothetical protein
MIAAFVDAALIVAAIVLAEWPFAPAFIESAYANGLFARMNELFVPLTNAVPFALGDLLFVVTAGGLAAAWIVGLRRASGRRLRAVALLALHTAGLAALIVLAFNLLWGLNYRRVPVASRVAYDPARVTPDRVSAFADRIVAILNDDVTAAHERAAHESPEAMRAELQRDEEPVLARLGDDWPVALTVPKVTLADRFYAMMGVGGQYDPFTFETLLNSTFLPEEVPRALAHEWSHVGGFGDEGDANWIGTVTCLRSQDPLIRYSAAFWTYDELPESDRRRLKLAPAVRGDFIAARERFLRYYTPQLANISWNLYDRYLRANGVAGGVVSYSRYLQLLVGTEFDAEGLPLRNRGGR